MPKSRYLKPVEQKGDHRAQVSNHSTKAKKEAIKTLLKAKMKEENQLKEGFKYVKEGSKTYRLKKIKPVE